MTLRSYKRNTKVCYAPFVISNENVSVYSWFYACAQTIPPTGNTRKFLVDFSGVLIRIELTYTANKLINSRDQDFYTKFYFCDDQ